LAFIGKGGTNMDRSKCKQIADAVLKAVKDIESTFNVKASYSTGRYGDTSCQLKFEFADVAADGMAQEGQYLVCQGPNHTGCHRIIDGPQEGDTRAAKAWELAVLDGLPADGLGKVFTFRGTEYKVTGYKPNCKYNIIAERVHDGRGFKFEALAVFRRPQGRPAFAWSESGSSPRSKGQGYRPMA